MGMYDSFWGQDRSVTHDGVVQAQLKHFECNLDNYKIGDPVPVKEYGYPETATFCDWGGVSQKYSSGNLMGNKDTMGTFVVIKDGRLHTVTEQESEVIKPVYSKYGELLDE